MAEEEVSYATVKFKKKKHSTKVKKEETVYDEVEVKMSKGENEAKEKTPDTNDKTSDRTMSRHRHYKQLACCLGIICVMLVLGIIAVTVYHLYCKLSSDTEDLRRNQTNLILQIHNLTRDSTLLEKQLAEKNQELEKKNEELETEKKNLKEIIEQMTTRRDELNVSRAQWSIDAYCPKEKNSNNRKCNACQAGWLYFEPSCYVVHNAERAEWKTWEEARENCRGKSSDLAVVINEEEKKNVSKNSWKDNENKRYWIGLRVEDGKWKWLDGRNLTDSSWMNQPPSDGHCAISVQDEGFKSVRCDETNPWICNKKALSV
ncbi:C-type lectin domain family 12 member B-like isoform X1 [Haplochromis burtoni]|uniref:C-type lectin domain family 12 member B-like isoform X1 n=1 Tax=Haplochromis burtoni TaxID=8153 RepID=UPI001C2D7622|nr:C-type lectin domain family 12 member B-like isoform X1 [Haplochromis burtoni]